MTRTWHTIGPWTDSGPEAAAVLLADRHGRICLQLRDDFEGVKGAGLFGFFGGAREAGEPLADTALRELAEETGLRPGPGGLRPFARIRSPAGTRLYTYLATAPLDPALLRLGEGAGFACLTAAQIARFPCLPATRSVCRLWFGTHAAP